MILNLPHDIFKYELLQYLTLYDVAIFDTAFMNSNNRVQFLNKISEVTFTENINIYKINLKLLYKWLIIRKITNIFNHTKYFISSSKEEDKIIIMPKEKIIERFDCIIWIKLQNNNERKNYLNIVDLRVLKIYLRTKIMLRLYQDYHYDYDYHMIWPQYIDNEGGYNHY